jgi:hypothetical protein
MNLFVNDPFRLLAEIPLLGNLSSEEDVLFSGLNMSGPSFSLMPQ